MKAFGFDQTFITPILNPLASVHVSEYQNNPLKRQSLQMGNITQNETLEFPDFMKLSGTRIAFNFSIFNIH